MEKWADAPMFDMHEFDLESHEDCVRLKGAVVEAGDGVDSLFEVAEQMHHKLCDAMTKPLKTSQRFLQCLTELIALISLPPDVILQNKIFQLSMDQDGSRLVQAALQASNRKVQEGIVAELQGHVCEMVGSPHANHVLQRIIELLPPRAVSFIFEEVSQKWNPDFVAKHKFGCRVLERMIEHFPSACVFPAWAQFLDCLLCNATTHCYHAFATFIMQHLMEHGTNKHQRAIVAAVTQDLESAAVDSHASGVLDKALCFLPAHEQLCLASQILERDGLLGRMVAAGRPAAERLFRVVTGPLLFEAQRQLNNAFPDSAVRSKVLKSIFGSKSPAWDSDLGEVNGLASTMGVDVLVAPAPLSMGQIHHQGSPTLSVPQQQHMVSGVPAPFEYMHEQRPWLDTTVTQVFSLWALDPWAEISWNAEPMTH